MKRGENTADEQQQWSKLFSIIYRVTNTIFFQKKAQSIFHTITISFLLSTSTSFCSFDSKNGRIFFTQDMNLHQNYNILFGVRLVRNGKSGFADPCNLSKQNENLCAFLCTDMVTDASCWAIPPPPTWGMNCEDETYKNEKKIKSSGLVDTSKISKGLSLCV